MDPWKVREVKIEVKIYQLLQSLKKRRTGVELASFLNLPLCHIEVEMNRRTGAESTNTQLIDPWLVYRQFHNFAASGENVAAAIVYICIISLPVLLHF